MAITLLQLTNAVLKRVGEIAGDSEELATSTVTSTATGLTATEAFTDSRRQHKIDIVLQLANESVHEIYSMGLMAKEAASATIALVANQREYDLPSDFERMSGNTYDNRAIRGATTGLIIREYPGGYQQLIVDRAIATDYTGDPISWALSPVEPKISFDNYPTSDQAGDTYNFLYDKRLTLSSTMATSALPFSDTVADCLVPVISESYNRVMKKEFDQGFLVTALSRAIGYLTRTQPKDRYGVNRGG